MTMREADERALSEYNTRLRCMPHPCAWSAVLPEAMSHPETSRLAEGKGKHNLGKVGRASTVRSIGTLLSRVVFRPNPALLCVRLPSTDSGSVRFSIRRRREGRQLCE